MAYDWMDNADPVAQDAAARNVVGLPPSDEAANKQKAMDMMRSIVGLNPNTNNYSLQDAISQLKGEYKAPGGPQGMGAMAPTAPPQGSMMQPPAQGMAVPPSSVNTPPPQQAVNDTGRVNPAIAALANARLGNQMQNRGQNRFAPTAEMKKGGGVKAYAKGGSVSASSRGDGCAQRGKTRGMMR